MKFVCKDLSDTSELARRFYGSLPERATVFLSGEIGSGKTTFVKCCLEASGAQLSVTSPTFNIVNIYELPNSRRVLHLDLYRIKNPNELYQLGIEDYLTDSTVFVEWPELFATVFSEADYNVSSRIVEGSYAREFEISGAGNLI